MQNCANVSATLHAHLCEHDWHGYTQGSGRWGDGEGVCVVNVDGRNYELEQGDRDCSSSVIECWQLALQGTAYDGALGTLGNGGPTYTGNMRAAFVGSGLFEWKPMSFTAQRGDVYLNERDHTAMCQSAVPDMLSQFSINELGGIVGGQVGDQTGGESSVRSYYDYPWDGILHYNGGADADAPATDTPHQEPGDPANDAGISYRAHVAALGWLDPVHDGQVAGTTGHGLELEALKIDPPDGIEFDAKLHIEDVGWTTFSDVAKNDPVIGTEGRALRAEALELDVKSNTTGKRLWYQVHLAYVGWTGWVEAGYTAGTVGIGKAIEAVRLKLV